MKKSIVVCGYGPGISDAVARKFGQEGYAVALVARRAEKLAAGAEKLRAGGIEVATFPTDLADPAAVKKLIAEVHAKLGPIAILHWNAYPTGAGDLTTAGVDELRAIFDLGVTSLVVAVQSALADLRAHKGEAAVLMTGGTLCLYDAEIDAMAVQWGSMGLALAKSGQHKLAGLLAAKLGGEGIYVGEVVVGGLVKGTAFDNPNATIEPAAVAEKLWTLFRARAENVVIFR